MRWNVYRRRMAVEYGLGFDPWQAFPENAHMHFGPDANTWTCVATVEAETSEEAVAKAQQTGD